MGLASSQFHQTKSFLLDIVNMPTYKVIVKIPNQNTRKNLVSGRYSLTLATGFSSDKGEHFNIGALVVKDMAPHIEITWTTDYKLEATKTQYKPGASISVSSDSAKVKVGDGYFLQSWADTAKVKTDRTAPRSGFNFNNNVIASSVVSQLIQGKYYPAFISPFLLQPGTQSIVPVPKAKLWFQNSFNTPTMITKDVSKAYVVDLSDKSTAILSYDENDGWSHE